MKSVLFKSVAVFFLLIVATSVMIDVFQTEFGTENFFRNHGVFFLFFITLFPRLTLLFSSVPFGGIIWWAGFIFCPRILVATLATVAYFHTNPLLVTLSWVVAFGGEAFEKRGITGKNRFVFRTYRMGSAPGPFSEEPGFTHTTIKKDDAIEAEFRKES
jgi:hypothetical protein